MDLVSPAEFVQSYSAVGRRKCEAPLPRLILLGVLAGLFIGLGGVAANTAAHAMPNASAARLVSGLLFPFGLIMVMVTGSELFTGNCLITISVLDGSAKPLGMLRNLSAVYAANFIGALALAAACAYCGQLDHAAGGLAVYTIRCAAAKCALPFLNGVALGALCNILVCAGVAMGMCSRSLAGRAIGAYVPVAVFVICGFEHCIANIYFVPAGLFALTVPKYAALAASAGVDVSALTWGNFLSGNLLPVTIGNILGGCLFAAAMWYSHRQRAEVRN